MPFWTTFWWRWNSTNNVTHAFFQLYWRNHEKSGMWLIRTIQCEKIWHQKSSDTGISLYIYIYIYILTYLICVLVEVFSHNVDKTMPHISLISFPQKCEFKNLFQELFINPISNTFTSPFLAENLLFTVIFTMRKVSKYGVFSGPNMGKFGPKEIQYLVTFHEVFWTIFECIF